jgi:hypothetical protein
LPEVAWFRSQVRSCGICDEQRGNGADFLLVVRFPLPIVIPWSPSRSLIVLLSALYGLDTGWTAEGSEFESRHVYDFSPLHLIQFWGPPNLLSIGYWVLCPPEVNRPGNEAAHSPRPSTEVENTWISFISCNIFPSPMQLLVSPLLPHNLFRPHTAIIRCVSLKLLHCIPYRF